MPFPRTRAFGVTYRDMKVLGERLGRNHELAAALWDTGVYEARMVASFVDDPSRVTPTQMERLVHGLRTTGASATPCVLTCSTAWRTTWAKVTHWSGSKREFVKRTAFALLWSLSVHDKRAGNEPFVQGLVLIEARRRRRT